MTRAHRPGDRGSKVNRSTPLERTTGLSKRGETRLKQTPLGHSTQCERTGGA